MKMLKPLIKLRDLKELQSSQKQKAEHDDFITPFKVKKPRKSRASTATKTKATPTTDEQQQPVTIAQDTNSEVPATPTDAIVVVPATPKTGVRRSGKSALRREPPPSQLRIHSFFKSCEKTYKIEAPKQVPPTPLAKRAAHTEGKDKESGTRAAHTEGKDKASGTRASATSTKKSSCPPKRARKTGRKRLFTPEASETEDELISNGRQPSESEWKPILRASKTPECIMILSDSEEEEKIASKENYKVEKPQTTSKTSKKRQKQKATPAAKSKTTKVFNGNTNSNMVIPSDCENAQEINLKCYGNNSATSLLQPAMVCEIDPSSLIEPLEVTPSELSTSKTPARTTKPKPSSAYKVVEKPLEPAKVCEIIEPLVVTPSEPSTSKTPATTTKRKPKPSPSYKVVEKPLEPAMACKIDPSSLIEPLLVTPSEPSTSKTPATTTKRKPKPCPPYKVVEKPLEPAVESKIDPSSLIQPLVVTPSEPSTSKTPATITKRKPKPCPPYKVVEGTTFAVDAFQYGYINGVTHYFLTHFHADHYIGLTRKFAMPLYMSPVTARLVRSFIPIDEQYIYELELNVPIVVEDIEITALDANHCPGAIMLLFKFPLTGKCILHTGDFRAWHGMESEPDFWHNDIHTIYLDTTYISDNYAFCTQYESIDKAKYLIGQFREKHLHERILYVCGSYVIGKEKFWSAIAEEYSLKVWTEQNRGKALKAISDVEHTKHLVENPKNADMHVIAMGKVSYLTLVEYFALYEQDFDLLLAIRPSGWEKDSKPQLRGKINIIGIEYSEHSSYAEMQRFVKFLKPKKVISTVPTGRDLMKTAIVPEKWYKYENLQSSSNYQPRIEQYFGKTPNKNATIRMPNEDKGGVETCVSPLKKRKATATTTTDCEVLSITNTNVEDAIVSLQSSQDKSMELYIPGISKSNQENNIQGNNNSSMEKIETITNGTKNRVLRSNGKTALVSIKNEPKSPPQSNAAGVVISQSLNDNESCSIMSGVQEALSRNNSSDFFETDSSKNHGRNKNNIKNKNDSPTVSRYNSSDYFEEPIIKIKKPNQKASMTSTSSEELPVSQKAKKRLAGMKTSSEEELPVSQKSKTRLASKERPAASVASTMSEDELAYQILLMQQSEKPARPGTEPFQQTKNLRVTPSNPILKSTTTSYASSINGTEPFQQTKPLRVTQSNPIFKSTTTSYASSINENDIEIVQRSEQIPASQTTIDLANTPRPLRNKFKTSCSQIKESSEQIPASQTTSDIIHTPRPLRNKMKFAYQWQANGDGDDVIPASQTSKDLENTPRPIRNKRLKFTLSSSTLSSTNSNSNSPKKVAVTPSKRAKRSTSTTALTQILEENETLNGEHEKLVTDNEGLACYTSPKGSTKLVNFIDIFTTNQNQANSLNYVPSTELDADDDWIY